MRGHAGPGVDPVPWTPTEAQRWSRKVVDGHEAEATVLHASRPFSMASTSTKLRRRGRARRRNHFEERTHFERGAGARGPRWLRGATDDAASRSATTDEGTKSDPDVDRRDQLALARRRVNLSLWEIGAAHWDQRDLSTRNNHIDDFGYGRGPSFHARGSGRGRQDHGHPHQHKGTRGWRRADDAIPRTCARRSPTATISTRATSRSRCRCRTRRSR